MIYYGEQVANLRVLGFFKGKEKMVAASTDNYAFNSRNLNYFRPRLCSIPLYLCFSLIIYYLMLFSTEAI